MHQHILAHSKISYIDFGTICWLVRFNHEVTETLVNDVSVLGPVVFDRITPGVHFVTSIICAVHQ